MNILRLTSWNWPNKESREQFPVQDSQQMHMSPFTLHRKIDKLFDDAFRSLGYGFAKYNGDEFFSHCADIAASPKEDTITAELP